MSLTIRTHKMLEKAEARLRTQRTSCLHGSGAALYDSHGYLCNARYIRPCGMRAPPPFQAKTLIHIIQRLQDRPFF